MPVDGRDGAVAGHAPEVPRRSVAWRRSARRARRWLRRGGARCPARRPRPAPASLSRRSPSATTSVTSGCPLVRVPVLSITTVSMRADVSRAVAFLNSTPRWAPRPEPTMIAVGVASPSASGQVMTTTVMAKSMASSTELPTAIQAGERERPADQGDQHQPERGTVGQPLAGCLGVLGLLHQRDDLGERGVGADLGGAHAQRPGGVDRGADHLDAGGLGAPGRLSPVTIDSSTSESPVLDDGVDRDLRPGADQQQVADDDLSGVDLDRFAVAQDQRLGRGQVEQGPDGVVGAAAGAHLEPVAEQHEGRQHGGGLVEDLAAAGEGDDDAVEPAGPDRRRRPAPSCRGCGPAAPGRRRRRRSTPSRRRPAGSAAARTRRRAGRTAPAR